jgi:flagellar basal-body rod protein FlgG
MSPSLFQVLNISSHDMASRIEDLNNSSNNLANLQTTGYKQSRVNFQELLDGLNLSGVKISSTQTIISQGEFKSTGIPTDLAIYGDGYFAVTLPDGTKGYTRDGQLGFDATGKLINSSGFPIVWQGTIPTGASKISIDSHGKVTALVDEAWVQAGSIQLTRFTNPGGLNSYGSNIWVEGVNSGIGQTGVPGSVNFGEIVPGALESSNVNMGDEMAHMITIQRSFQMASKAFQTTGEMIDAAIHLRKV